MTENDKIMIDADLYVGAFLISAPQPILWLFIVSDPWDIDSERQRKKIRFMINFVDGSNVQIIIYNSFIIFSHALAW